ncbi:hypothetical protein ACHAXS_012090 [Conticribra weissflogii]
MLNIQKMPHEKLQFQHWESHFHTGKNFFFEEIIGFGRLHFPSVRMGLVEI